MEDERPVEKLLRSYARKRRAEAGAPLELRPAVRRRLQDEVARHFGEKREGERVWPALWLRLASFRPRLAWGLASLVLLGVAVALLVPGVNRSKGPRMLARNSRVSPAPAPPEAPGLQPPPASVARPPAAPQRELSKSSGELLADKRLPVPPAAPPPAREPAQEKKPSDGAPGPPSVSAPVPGEAPARQFGDSFTDALASSPGNTRSALAAAPQLGTVPGGTAATPVERRLQPASAVQDGTRVAGATAIAPRAGGDEAAQFKNNQTDNAAYARRYGPAPGSAARSFSYAKAEPAAVSGTLEREKAKDIPLLQKFVRAAPKAPALRASNRVSDRASPADAVLDAFQVEHSGRRLVVTDSDGSVYTGYLQLTNADSNAEAAAASSPARQSVRSEAQSALRASRLASAAVAPSAQSSPSQSLLYQLADTDRSQNYFFQVVGTNRSLNQKVVFSGHLIRLADSPTAPGSRISGKAAVGERREIQIEAVLRQP